MSVNAVDDRVSRSGPNWTRRYSELIVVAGVLALAVFLTVETVRMEVPEGAGTPGPQFFPVVVAGFLYVQAVLLAIDVLRHPAGDTDDSEPAVPAAPKSDLRTMGLALGALVIFVLILVPVGWLIAATFLFWAICTVLGSRRPVFDLAIAALVAAVIQLAFSAGLGLNLPAGIFEGVL